MTDDIETLRQELVARMLSARTRPEIEQALADAAAWLKEHPGDVTVLSAGEGLAMVAEHLGISTLPRHGQ